MADGMHGIAPSVIAGMQQPVLVRIMPPEKVTTGFVSRSNFDQVLQRSKAEVAAEDAPKIRANLSQYRFDENGNPTKETTRQFIIDVGEPNALGSLITADGEPTLDAVERIKIAAFHEAYQSPALTEYFAAEVNPNIRKILNAMAMFAPRLIQIREATAGAIDLGPALVYAANAVHNQRIRKLPLEDLIGIQDKLATPAAGPVTDFLVRNVNSAAAINRVLNDLADWVVATTQTTSTDDIFGGSLAVRADLSDALAQLRRLENQVLAEKGQLALPDIDVADLRSRVAEFVEQQAREAQVAADKQRAMSSQQEIADVPPAEIESAEQTVQTQVLEGVANDPDAIRLQEITASNPEQTFMFEDDDGVVRELRLDEVDAEVQRIEAEGKTEASGLAQAAICIIRNEGI